MLDALAERAGYRQIALESVGSTNDEAFARARAGDPGRLWITAASQSQGRGREGRPWSSPPGNLYASLLLVDAVEPRCAAQLGFVAGLALAQAVHRLIGSSVPIHIKWPNDLVHNGRKLAGVLVEGSQLPNGSFACVLGFGVNCSSHPTGLSYETTDVAAVAAVPVSAADLFAALSLYAPKVLALWDRGKNFAAIREAWLARALPQGSPLTVNSPRSRIVGSFEAIDEQGRLIVSTPSGPVTVESGDVFLVEQDRASA